ncbi:hypothetical protein J3A83DRAFT_4367330 [Scleroderma citrinum]
MLMLQSMYVDQVTKELANNEEKWKKKKIGQLNGDGLPKLLTSEEFYNQVVDHHKSIAEQDVAHKAQQKQKDEWNGLLSAWKEGELWEVERDQAKAENCQPHWAKPKCGRLEWPVPKPITNGGDTEGEGDNVVNEEDGDNKDMQSDHD